MDDKVVRFDLCLRLEPPAPPILGLWLGLTVDYPRQRGRLMNLCTVRWPAGFKMKWRGSVTSTESRGLTQ